ILWLKLMGCVGPRLRPSWTENDWVNAAVPAASTIRAREARTRARFMAGAETKQASRWCQPGLSRAPGSARRSARARGPGTRIGRGAAGDAAKRAAGSGPETITALR